MKSEIVLLQKLKANTMFVGVDEVFLRNLAGKLESANVEAGTMIFEDESPGDCMYLILSGEVTVSKITAAGYEVILGILRERDFFGELDLIDGLHRSARAVAKTDCMLARLERNEFHLLLEASPRFAHNLLRMVSARLRAGNLIYIRHEETSILELRRQIEKMHTLAEASKTVNSSIDIDQLLTLILHTAIQTVGADRGTLYVIDSHSNELWSKVQQGPSIVEIRLPVGKGLAGTVAATGETINIADAYGDKRFNPEVDKTTGYHTKTVLCMPMKKKDGTITGVFQLLNKVNGVFSREDEEFIDALSAHASIAIENARLAQQMIQAERLSAVGSMAGSIIHDIKNPMSVLRLSAQVIKEKSHDKQIVNLAGEMMLQVDRFVAMTQEILDFSRGVGALSLKPVDPSSMIESSLAFVENDLSHRRIQLIKDLRFSGTIHADSDKLSRVLYNIVSNAADAMPKGGTVTVRTLAHGHRLVIECSDTGCGMSPEVKAKIFQPFVTYGKQHGTGLGMAIVKKIIDDHQGTIEVESEINKGTTIRVLLPL